jgi:hypothetical protein
MRCACTACQIEAALALLRAGRQTSMAILLLEQALLAERERVERTKPPARRGRKARARA